MDPSRLIQIADRLFVALLVMIAALGVVVAWSAGLLAQFGVALAIVAAPALLPGRHRGR